MSQRDRSNRLSCTFRSCHFDSRSASRSCHLLGLAPQGAPSAIKLNFSQNQSLHTGPSARFVQTVPKNSLLSPRHETSALNECRWRFALAGPHLFALSSTKTHLRLQHYTATVAITWLRSPAALPLICVAETTQTSCITSSNSFSSV